VIIVNIKVLPTDDIVSKHISQIYLIAFMCVVNFNFQSDTMSVLLVEETGVSGKNHRQVTTHRHEQDSNSQF
jgi:hypothetical protein